MSDYRVEHVQRRIPLGPIAILTLTRMLLNDVPMLSPSLDLKQYRQREMNIRLMEQTYRQAMRPSLDIAKLLAKVGEGSACTLSGRLECLVCSQQSETQQWASMQIDNSSSSRGL